MRRVHRPCVVVGGALLLGLSAGLANEPGPVSGKKLALLVGIDEYAVVTPLHGCLNDVETMKEVLVGKFDFPPQNVTVLKNGQATRAGILQGLQGLIDRAEAGDIVVFHYSGHGSRMQDVSHQKADGWSETIVPQDGRKPGVFDISDHELNGLLHELAHKTRNITFILDSCHSGTGARGGAVVRQIADDLRTPPPLAPFAARVSRGLDGPSGMRPRDADYVLIAACRATELSNEYDIDGRRQGALTYSLSSALTRAGSGSTWRDVMDEVRTAVSAVFPSQHPQLEGARADGWVFGDRDSLAESYMLVSPVMGGIEVQAGAAQGLARGARLAIYPPQTRSFGPPSRPLATIELQQVGTFRSQGSVVEGGPVPSLSRAVLREVVYPNARLTVNLAGANKPSPVLRKVEELLRGYPSVSLVSEQAAANLVVREDAGVVYLSSADLGQLGPSVPAASPGAAEGVARAVAGWARWRRLLDLQNGSSRRRVRLAVGFPGSDGDSPADLSVTEGQTIELRVKNLSDVSLYMAILDLASDGSVQSLYPPAGSEEELPAGQTLRHVVGAGVPTGLDRIVDIVKVIATTEPIDPSIFAQTTVQVGDAPVPRAPGSSSLAAFLEDSVVGRPRTLTRQDPDDWTTAERRLTIMRGDRGFESFALHFDGPTPSDLGSRVASVRDVCGDPGASCWQAETFYEGSGVELVRSALPTGKRTVEHSFGTAWDEAYRLRQVSGAQRAEPLFELEMPEPDAEAAESGARSGGTEKVRDGAKKDSLWSLKHVDAFGAWAKLQASGRADGEEGASVVIGHLDTGYRDHPEFWDKDEARSRVLFSKGYDFLHDKEDAYDPLDISGFLPNPSHGTKSGSTIVSPKGKQLLEDTDPTHIVDGIAPGAHLVPALVHRSVVHLSSERLGRAIFEAAGDRRDKLKLPVQIISISMGGLPSWTLWRAVRFAEQRGVIVVAAAGNNVGTVVWPARFKETIAVAATNVDCGTWAGSSRGPAVDISAPGESVWHAATLREKDGKAKNIIEYSSGTTYATAITAGAAALWLDFHRADPMLAKLQRVGQLTGAFRSLLKKTAWRPNSGQLPPGVTCAPGTGWNASAFGAGIVEASRLLDQPLPAVQATREVAAVGFADLPLFASLAQRPLPREVVASRFARLLRAPEGAEVKTNGDLEGEVVFNYSLSEEVRTAVDPLMDLAEPSAGDYEAGRVALLRQDISSRLRRVLRGEG